MEHTKSSNSWFKIELSIDNVGAENLCFQVKFINNDETERELEFSNRSAKAEFMCLTILDESEKLVNPQRRDIPRLKNQQSDRHRVEAGGYWLFSLTGELLDDWLEFVGAAYKLKQGDIYLCSFEYMGVVSNQCKLVV